MKKNKTFNVFINLGHAFNGIIEVAKNENAFKIELAAFVILSCLIPFFPIKTEFKFVLALSLFLPLIAEMINSAIERVVDLVTEEWAKMAKYAKDAASAVVLLTLLLTGGIWLAIGYLSFF